MKKTRWYHIQITVLLVLCGLLQRTVAELSGAEIDEAIKVLSVNYGHYGPEKLPQELANVVKMGDAIIDPLMMKLRTKNGYYKHKSPDIERSDIEQRKSLTSFNFNIRKVLYSIGSQRAANSLLQIAIGNTKRSREGDGYAAKLYLELIKSKEEAAKLLGVVIDTHDRVAIQALRHMRGLPIDEQPMEKIKKMLVSKRPSSRYAAVDFIAAAPTDPNEMSNRADLIIGSMIKANRLEAPNARQKSFAFAGTEKERLMVHHCLVLSKLIGIDGYMKEASDKGSNNEIKPYLLMARALHGDAEVSVNLLKAIITDVTRGTNVRLFAIDAYCKIASEEDIAFLQETAKRDALYIVNPKENTTMRDRYAMINGKVIEYAGIEFPEELKEEAKKAINKEYLIREAAGKAIVRISSKDGEN